MIRHKCWRCQKEEAADVEWFYCPTCGAPYQDRHKENTQNMPIVGDLNDDQVWVTGGSKFEGSSSHNVGGTP